MPVLKNHQDLLIPMLAGTLVLALLLLMGGAPCLAGPTPPGLQQADKELRNAQRIMFKGKSDEAIALLPRIRQLLEEGKKAAPDHPKVKTIENQLQKLVKDLERRTGKNLGGGSITVSQSSGAPPPPDKSTVKPATPAVSAAPSAATKPTNLPRQLKVYLGQLEQILGRAEDNIKRLADPKDRFNKKQLQGMIKEKLAEAEKVLGQAKAEAAKNGIADLPQLDQGITRFQKLSQEAGAVNRQVAQNQAAAAKTAKGVEADVMSLEAERKCLDPVFAKAPGTVIYYNDLVPIKELLALIQQFEQKDAAPLKARLEAYAVKYGSTAQAIDDKAKAAGYEGQTLASRPYVALSEGMIKVAKTRQVMAEDLVKRAQQKLESLPKLHDFFRIAQHKQIKEYLQMAAAFKADNPMVKKALAEIDIKLSKDTEAFKATLAKRTWSTHSDNAPPGADNLAKAAMEMFKKDIGWGRRDQNPRAKDKEPRRPLAVVITGPWSIQKRNIMSEPIMWGLPVKLAVQVDSEKEAGLARIFILTLRTDEARGVKKAPPFTSVTVGNSYYMLADKVR